MDARVENSYASQLENAWHNEVCQRLSEMDSERQATVLKAAFVSCALTSAAFLSTDMLIELFQVSGGDILDIKVMAHVLALAPGAWMLAKLKARVKDEFIQSLFGKIGWRFDQEPSAPSAFKDYKRYKMLPRHNVETFEDRVSGHHEGVYFEMTEMKLVRSQGRRSTTVFRGFALHVDFHQTFASTTIVLRDKKLLNRRKFEGLKRVGMASPKWEQLFEAYSNDQVEARVKLDPAFMERLMKLEDSVDGKNLRFGFFDNCLHVLCETPNRFEPGHMFTRLDNPKRFHKFQREVDALIAVLEGVRKTDEPARYTPPATQTVAANVPTPTPVLGTPLPGWGQANPYL